MPSKTFGTRALGPQVRRDRLLVGEVDLEDRDPGDCPRLHGDEGPCPFIGCKHHLFSDVTPDGGLRVTHPTIDPWDLPATCALDVARETGGLSLSDIGVILNLTREQVGNIVRSALEKLSNSRELAAMFLEASEERERGIRQGGIGDADGNADRTSRDPRFDPAVYRARETSHPQWRPLTSSAPRRRRRRAPQQLESEICEPLGPPLVE